jgi:hypothetical protein
MGCLTSHVCGRIDRKTRPKAEGVDYYLKDTPHFRVEAGSCRPKGTYPTQLLLTAATLDFSEEILPSPRQANGQRGTARLCASRPNYQAANNGRCSRRGRRRVLPWGICVAS